jgi:RNA 2',3'-cyclic 3'-phosphodiesterase
LAVRLFTAIPLDDVTRAYVATALDLLQREGISARWVPPENWHVTLAFLGEIDDARYPAVVTAFKSVLAPVVRGQASLTHNRIAPFSLHLSGIGAFPNLRRPRVLWVGGKECDSAFGAAALAIRSAFTPLGFRFDDAATAHVTIGRASGSISVRPPTLQAAISMPVTRFVLFESARGRAGVRYVEREAVILS